MEFFRPCGRPCAAGTPYPREAQAAGREAHGAGDRDGRPYEQDVSARIVRRGSPSPFVGETVLGLPLFLKHPLFRKRVLNRGGGGGRKEWRIAQGVFAHCLRILANKGFYQGFICA